MIGTIMRRDFVSTDSREPLESARQTMRMGRLRSLLVVDGDALVGVLSYRDLLEHLLATRSLAVEEPGSVADLMLRVPTTVSPATSFSEAADLVCRYGFGCLPVVEAATAASPGGLLGIVTERDLLRAAYRLRSG